MTLHNIMLSCFWSEDSMFLNLFPEWKEKVIESLNKYIDKKDITFDGKLRKCFRKSGEYWRDLQF